MRGIKRTTKKKESGETRGQNVSREAKRCGYGQWVGDNNNTAAIKKSLSC